MRLAFVAGHLRDSKLGLNSRRANGTGFVVTPSNAACVITRFELRSLIYMPMFFLAYRQVAKQTTRVTGLVKSEFLVKNPWVCYNLSIWTNDEAIVEFNNICLAHFGAVRWGVRLITQKVPGAYGMCSLHFRLHALSNNRIWGGTDLGTLLVPPETEGSVPSSPSASSLASS